MKADICDVCERRMDKRFGKFFQEYRYWTDHDYPQESPSDGLELCESCMDKLLAKVYEIRRTNGLDYN